MLLGSVWGRKQEKKVFVAVFNRETREVEVQSIYVFDGFQNQ